eukprot:6305444-Prorocentrum_lima.AAC.1
MLLSKNLFKTKAKELEDARLDREARLIKGEQLDLLQSVQAERKAKARATAKSRVPAHKVSVPLSITLNP